MYENCPFDGVWYLQQNPDVAADGKYNTPETAYIHYIEFGQAEGRKPGPNCNGDITIDPDDDNGNVDDPGNTGGSGIMDWIKANPLAALAIGSVAFYLITKKR